MVPVPIHPERLAERGFNQAELLAAALAKMLGLPLVPDALRRRLTTPPQAGLGREARLSNLVRAIGPGHDRQAVGSRDVLLVDDVLTTGATMESCARALLAGGASRVGGVVVAVGVSRRLWGDLPSDRRHPQSYPQAESSPSGLSTELST